MQRSNNACTISLQPIELRHRFAGFRDSDLNTHRPERLDRLLGDLHTSVVAGSDDKHLRRVGHDSLQVFLRESVPLLAPPAFLNMVGKDDDVGVVVTATDADTSECVVVDLHGSKAVNLCGVMVDPGQGHLSQFSSSERS